uniref:MSP domain-containing protein n=1 Tax=Ascaris lumbricoides TaxID=6252 RepID=A0A0M3ICH1_ASCLU
MAEYSASKGGGSRHLLMNTGKERIVIKIKCSNNEFYRVSPVYSFLNPGKALRLYIVRDPGPAKVDKLVLIYMSSTCKNPREAFATQIETQRNERRKTLIALVAHDLPHRLRADT